MSMQAFDVDQMALVTAISKELSRQKPNLPFESSLYNKVIEAANLIAAECRRERIQSTAGMTPQEWLASDDVGESSRYMITVLASLGLPMPDGATPSDGDDLGRCIRMVDACGLESEIHRLESMGDDWCRIAKNWASLKEWYADSDYQAIYTFLNKRSGNDD